ncbi:MAG: DUF3288 family protein [Microcoleaceae cyanobacterium]
MPEKKLEQQHPQYFKDRRTVNDLAKAEEPTNLNLCELARLKIRYQGFPGARDIQKDLEDVMQKWGFPEEESLFTKTRQIHADGLAYQRNSNEQDDWI